ncbi:FHA domain-containing protein [Verrucomicrobiales bacterium]|nr:FHA domain-containing protein [Verrucomicrobiales bacterium]
MKHGLKITFPDGKDHHFLLSAKSISIGRGKENGIVIPCNRVSTKHCELRRKAPNGTSFEIIDLGSTNGTILNDEAVESEHARELRDGDTLMIGLDLKASFYSLEEVGVSKVVEKPSISEVAGAVTVRLKEIQKPRPEPAINPVAAAVARAENGAVKTS